MCDWVKETQLRGKLNPAVIKVRHFTNNIFGVENFSFTPKHNLREMRTNLYV